MKIPRFCFKEMRNGKLHRTKLRDSVSRKRDGKHKTSCFRYVSVGRKCEIELLVGSLVFPLCFLNGNIMPRFRRISVDGFMLLSVSVMFPHTDSNIIVILP